MTLTHLLNKYSLAFKYMQCSVISSGDIKTVLSLIQTESTWGKKQNKTKQKQKTDIGQKITSGRVANYKY